MSQSINQLTEALRLPEYWRRLLASQRPPPSFATCLDSACQWLTCFQSVRIQKSKLNEELSIISFSARASFTRSERFLSLLRHSLFNHWACAHFPFGRSIVQTSAIWALHKAEELLQVIVHFEQKDTFYNYFKRFVKLFAKSFGIWIIIMKSKWSLSLILRVKACGDVFIICNLSIPHLFFVLFFFRKFAVEFIVTALLLCYFLSVKSQSAKQDYFNNLVLSEALKSLRTNVQNKVKVLQAFANQVGTKVDISLSNKTRLPCLCSLI